MTLKVSSTGQVLRLYAATDTERTTDLLADVEQVSKIYTTELPAGDYRLYGYMTDSEGNEYCCGSIKLVVTREGEPTGLGDYTERNYFYVLTASGMRATNSGWVDGTDYTTTVTVYNQSFSFDREPEFGVDAKGYKSTLCFEGDGVRVTYTPDAELHPEYLAITKTQTLNASNSAFSAAIPYGVKVTFVAAAKSTIDVGQMTNYYVLNFYEDPEVETLEDGRVSYTYTVPKSTTCFYRVKNPDGVTYWSYNSWSTATTVEITDEQLNLNSTEFTSDTVYRNYEKNIYDLADVYLATTAENYFYNSTGYLNLDLGESFELNAFRNWFAINSFINDKIAVPDFDYEIVTIEGDNVLSIEKDAKNSAVANVTATGNGTAIILVTYIWSSMDPQTLAENKGLLYWLNLNVFNPGAQFAQAAAQTESVENVITVQNIGACSRYLYVPFSLCAGAYQQTENLNTDCVTSNGDRIYAFSAVSNGAEKIGQVLEYLQTAEEAAVLNYRKAESAYRSFVYSQYLQVPQEMMDTLAQQWDEAAAQYGSVDSLTSQQAQECVLTFLNQRSEIEKETSFQQATTAVMTLRYFGIPARYAEGYVITEEMVKAAENGDSIEVDSSCARAWAEVYQDGIGWIPMDLTPQNEEMTGEGANAQNDEKEQAGSSEIKEGQEQEQTPEEKTETEQPEGGYLVAISSAAHWGAVILLLFLIALLLLILIRRKLLLKRRERKFQAENRNDAVAWIFADTAQLLENLGFLRGNGSMLELREPIRWKYGDGYAAAFESMVDLNSRAMFSSRGLEESQREKALAFRRETVQCLKSERKWYARLWMKWIRCLY